MKLTRREALPVFAATGVTAAGALTGLPAIGSKPAYADLSTLIVYPTIKEKYIDTGKAKLYFRSFPFDPAAAAATMLAECSGDKYFNMVDILYDKQATWSRGKVVDELFKISKLAGFTQESFNACLKNQELLDNVLSIQKKAAEVYEVNATPTFFINGTKYSGNMSAEAMGEVIDSLV